jgi:DNA-binding response OmpR family regulator
VSTSITGLVKILIIDGNVFFAKRLGDALRKEGFDVTHATQASYALTMLEWNRPSAILCATNLRELNAFDLAKIVHADPAFASLPIIAVGEGDEHALMAAFRAGCDDYVDKRIGPDNMAAHVRVFLRSREDGFQPTDMLDSTETALEGSLSHLDLPGVIQMLCHSRKSGTLHINADQMDGIVFFDRGVVLHAESRELIGDEAVLQIIKFCNALDHGIYKFVPGTTATTRTVLRSVTELMLDALREIDEERAANDGGYK